MTDPAPPAGPEPARRLPRPLDLLALLGALLLAVAGWSILFRRTAPPVPVDPLLGMVLEVRYDADLPWKREFAPAGAAVRVDVLLRAVVERADPAGDGRPAWRTLRVRILDRGGQDPYVLTEYRGEILRGSTVIVQDAGSLVNAEVLAVEPARKP